MDIQTILKKVEDLVTPVFGQLGYELVERELVMESGRWALRLYIDREGGVTIGDCGRASRSVEDLLEVEETVPVGYNLEVSSPGINRPLRYRRDFERFRGSRIRLRTRAPLNGRSNFRGTLEGLAGEDILMAVDGQNFRIPYSMLGRARIEPEDIPPKVKAN